MFAMHGTKCCLQVMQTLHEMFWGKVGHDKIPFCVSGNSPPIQMHVILTDITLVIIIIIISSIKTYSLP
jgi:hypothetical protein